MRTKASCRKDSRVEVEEKQDEPGVSYVLERKYNNNNNKETCGKANLKGFPLAQVGMT